MLPRLKALGYREVTLTAAGLLGPAGTTARGHEFHYSEIVGEPDRRAPPLPPDAPPGRRGRERRLLATNNVLASYVHLHFGSNPEVARHLVASCRAYRENLRERARDASPLPSPRLPPQPLIGGWEGSLRGGRGTRRPPALPSR